MKKNIKNVVVIQQIKNGRIAKATKRMSLDGLSEIIFKKIILNKNINSNVKIGFVDKLFKTKKYYNYQSLLFIKNYNMLMDVVRQEFITAMTKIIDEDNINSSKKRK